MSNREGNFKLFAVTYSRDIIYYRNMIKIPATDLISREGKKIISFLVAIGMMTIKI
jgi:hypothetical protein